MDKDTRIIIVAPRFYKILRLSQVIAHAAVISGIDVKTAEFTNEPLMTREIIHIKLGQKIHSPLISKNEANVVICFEPYLSIDIVEYYLSREGIIFLNSQPFLGDKNSFNEISAYFKNITSVTHEFNFLEFSREEGFDTLRINFSVLGMLIGKKCLPLSKGSILMAIEEIVPSDELSIYKNALNFGMKIST